MKKTMFNRLTLLGCCVALFTLASVTHTFGQNNSNPLITTLPVRALPNQSVVPAAGSMLVRNHNGIFMTLTTSGLVPGTAATAWLAIFNTPAGCATNPCTPADLGNPAAHPGFYPAGGRVVGADGTATFSAFRAVGDTSGSQEGATKPLLFPLTAEIHLVVRTHGAANLNDPIVLSQQLSLFNGGCPPNACASLQISIHQQ